MNRRIDCCADDRVFGDPFYNKNDCESVDFIDAVSDVDFAAVPFRQQPDLNIDDCFAVLFDRVFVLIEIALDRPTQFFDLIFWFEQRYFRNDLSYVVSVPADNTGSGRADFL